MTDGKETTPRKFQVPNTGIQAVHVNNARDMVELHTRGRLPHGQQTERTTQTSSVKRSMKVPIGSASKSSPKITVPSGMHEGNCSNPQCDHCGQVIIPSPRSSFPFKDQPSIAVDEWNIFTIKQPILSSQEIDDLNDTRFQFPLPEMIFGNNKVKIVHGKTEEVIEFNALDALDSMDSSSNLKVSYHKEWLSSRRTSSSSVANNKDSSSKDLTRLTDMDSLKPFDWTYSPRYKGTTNIEFRPTTKQIPIAKLMKQEPILFFDESVLYEDELGDNGISILSTKIRVMPSCLLLLCRFFLRIDNVIFRIRDTRVYVDFESNEVLREYKVQESLYSSLISKAKSTNDPKSLFRDMNWVSQNMPVISREVEIRIPPSAIA